MMKENKPGILQHTVVQVALATSALLAFLYVLMISGTEGLVWDETDFLFAAVAIFTIGMGLVVAAKNIRTKTHLALAGLVIAAAFIWLWIELAVGVFTNWGS